MVKKEVLKTEDETIDPNIKGIPACGDGLGIDGILPRLPEVGTYIPVVDGPVQPDCLLPESYPLPLTESTQLALDLSELDGSLSWVDNVFDLPLNRPWWHNMNTLQPLPDLTDNRMDRGDGQQGMQSGIQMNTVDVQQDLKERRRQQYREYYARKKQEKLTGVKAPPKLLKKDDPEHQAKMKVRKNQQSRQRRAGKKAKLAAAEALLAEAADLLEAKSPEKGKEDIEDEVEDVDE